MVNDTRHHHVRENLDAVEILKPLNPDERRALGLRCRWKVWEAGEQIIDRETESNDVYFVARGTARVVNYGVTGREVSFDDIPAGGSFGELAAIDGGKRSANVVAVDQTTTAILPAKTFHEVLIEHPPVTMAVLKRLARIVRASTGRIMDLSTLGAQNRIYAELLRLARQTAIEGNTGILAPIPVHSDIAARVSTTRETVARVLSDLQRRSLVRREKSSLVITDINRLSEMVEEFSE
ncbi:MAG: Crp/Fnr family transcriptional regulator [Alphaproteobacteria bacterium]|nr:Crp/Fnr family transcriptional regulator [Alphaproteobacteria bacterium]